MLPSLLSYQSSHADIAQSARFPRNAHRFLLLSLLQRVLLHRIPDVISKMKFALGFGNTKPSFLNSSSAQSLVSTILRVVSAKYSLSFTASAPYTREVLFIV